MNEKLSKLFEFAAEAPSGASIIDECMNLAEVLLKKNISYADSFATPPVIGNLTAKDALYCRMSDKINRLSNNQSYENEGMRDAIQDLAGYCLLWIILDNNDQRLTKKK